MNVPWSVVVIVAVAACGQPAKTPAPEAKMIGPLAADAGSDPHIDAVVADTMRYLEQTPAILMSFDGNCDAYADRLLKLEPLVETIRKSSLAILETDPDGLQVVKDRLKEHKEAVLAKMDAQLEALGATRADLESKEDAIKQKCASNAHVVDATERTGLFKRKKPSAPGAAGSAAP